MKKKLPKWLQSYLPSYDISKMDLYDPGDKEEIIRAVLNQGDMEAIRWLAQTYTPKDIARIVRNPHRGIWFRDVLYYWTKILNIKLPRIVYEVAIFNLNPRPKLMEKYFKYMEKTGKIPTQTLKLWKEIRKYGRLRTK